MLEMLHVCPSSRARRRPQSVRRSGRRRSPSTGDNESEHASDSRHVAHDVIAMVRGRDGAAAADARVWAPWRTWGGVRSDGARRKTTRAVAQLM